MLFRVCLFVYFKKVACWLDESVDVACVTCKFQTPAQYLSIESKSSQSSNLFVQYSLNERIVEMSTCNLFTLIRMSSGTLYWWGIMPYELRAKAIDKYQSKAHKSKSCSSSDFTLGSVVSLKSLPLFNAGSLAIAVRDGMPLLGQLLEHVFLFRDTKPYKFRVKSLESLRSETSEPMQPFIQTTSVSTGSSSLPFLGEQATGANQPSGSLSKPTIF
jgi:hypothetical protein